MNNIICIFLWNSAAWLQILKKSPNVWKKMNQKSHCAAVIVQNPFFNVLHKQTRCLNAQVDLHTSGP